LLGGSLGAVLLMGLAAIVIGFSKTALGGLAVISIAIFATMTANAAGAVMTLYLSASGIDKRRFIGTNAWFLRRSRPSHRRKNRAWSGRSQTT